jgi:hypothetical protein
LITFIEKNQQIGIQKLPYKFLSLPYPVVENAETAEKESTSENSDSISEEDTNKITEVIRNVRWLISEGYVTEYSDGKLWIHPKAEVNHSTSSTSPKNEKKDESGEVSVASKTEDSKTPEAIVEDEKEIVAVSEEKSTEECKNEASTSESCEIPHSSEEVNETEVESTDI